jgi:hypothetical protein
MRPPDKNRVSCSVTVLVVRLRARRTGDLAIQATADRRKGSECNASALHFQKRLGGLRPKDFRLVTLTGNKKMTSKEMPIQELELADRQLAAAVGLSLAEFYEICRQSDFYHTLDTPQDSCEIPA